MAAQRDLAARRALLVRHGRRRSGRDGGLGEGYPRLVGCEAGDADVVVAFCAIIIKWDEEGIKDMQADVPR